MLVICILTRKDRRHHSGKHDKHDGEKNATSVTCYNGSVISNLVVNNTNQQSNDDV